MENQFVLVKIDEMLEAKNVEHLILDLISPGSPQHWLKACREIVRNGAEGKDWLNQRLPLLLHLFDDPDLYNHLVYGTLSNEMYNVYRARGQAAVQTFAFLTKAILALTNSLEDPNLSGDDGFIYNICQGVIHWQLAHPLQITQQVDVEEMEQFLRTEQTTKTESEEIIRIITAKLHEHYEGLVIAPVRDLLLELLEKNTPVKAIGWRSAEIVVLLEQIDLDDNRIILHMEARPGGLGQFYQMPQTMAFFQSNEEFDRTLEIAWEYAKTHFPGDWLTEKTDIRWQLQSTKPIHFINGPSMGVGSLLALHLLVTPGKEFFDENLAVTGAITPEGQITSVTGYINKLNQAREYKYKVIMPAEDATKYGDKYSGVEINGASTIEEAITKATEITEKALIKVYDVRDMVNPYIGLKSFTYEDSRSYSGRAKDIKKVMNKLLTSPEPLSLFFINGPSGSGKSSFAQAGLLPQLEKYYIERKYKVRIAVFRPTYQPIEMLAKTFKEQLGLISEGPITPTNFNDFLREKSPTNQVNLLVLDQFEELLSDQSDPKQRDIFLEILKRLTGFNDTHTHIIATLRIDYQNELYNNYPYLYNRTKEGFDLHTMEKDDLKEAIKQPFNEKHPNSGKRFAPELVDKLADDAKAEATLLPLLQVTLEEIWRKGFLRPGAYNNLADSISERADTVLQYKDHAQAKEVPRSDEDQKEIMKIFVELIRISPDKTQPIVRFPRKRQELEEGQSNRRGLIDDLCQARLLKAEKENVDEIISIIDIIHEALINNWDKLKTAIKEQQEILNQREHFQAVLREWKEKEKAEKYLLNSVRLAEARELNKQNDVETRSPDAQELIKLSSLKAEAAQRRRFRTIGVVATGMTILALFAIGFGIVAWGQNGQLNATNKIIQARINASNVYTLLPSNPGGAAKFAVKSINGVSPPIIEAKDALREADSVSLQAILQKHKASVNWAVFSPDDSKIVSASDDGDAIIWNGQTGDYLYTLSGDQNPSGHKGRVIKAVFNFDGSKIATASGDGTAKIWNTQNGHLLYTLQGVEDPITTNAYPLTSIAFSPDGSKLATGSTDKTARVWDVKTGKQLLKLTGHTDQVTDVVFSPDNTKIATGSYDEIPRIWDANTGQLLIKFDATDSYWITSIAFSPDGKKLLTTGWGNTAHIWDITKNDTITGTNLLTMGLANGLIIINGSFSPDGTKVLLCTRDNNVQVWDAVNGLKSNSQTGRLLYLLSGDTDVMTSAVFSPDGQEIATSNNDGTARIWDATTGQSLLTLQAGNVENIAFSHKGDRVVTAGADGTLRIWGINKSQSIFTLQGHVSKLDSVSFSSDGTKVVTGSWDHNARVWDARTGKILTTLQGHTAAIRIALFSPDNKIIATASDDGTVRIWDAISGQNFYVLQGHTGPVFSVAFDGSGKYLTSASKDNTARVWDAMSGKNIAVLTGHTGIVWTAQFNHDQNNLLVVTASADQTARIWDAKNGTLLETLKGHTDEVRYAEFSPDDTKVVTASRDTTAQIWDVKTGNNLYKLTNHIGAVNMAVFSHDGTKIVTGSDDNTARVWDADTGQSLNQFIGHNEPVKSVAFAPNDEIILTASADKTARLWNVNSGRILQILTGHTKDVNMAVFDQGGNYIATASTDNNARIYKCTLCAPINTLITMANSYSH